MTFNLWFVVVGAVLIGMALFSTILKRLPLTTSMLYLAVGFAIGPYGLGLKTLDPLEDAALLERITEVAVIISLFTAGLKLRLPFGDRRWRVPLRLAFGSMMITVVLVTLVGVWGLGLPLGAAVLLGAILAPTDPVLASDVQVAHAGDPDQLRFGLTGEAGFNDGTAFPFVMLGLGLLGLHQIGANGWRWVAIDVAWAVTGGLAIGGILGTLVGYLVVYLRQERREAVGLDDFLALGLIFFSYGIALLAYTYGFLAVFAAGLALRRIERRAARGRPAADIEAKAKAGAEEEVAVDPETAPAFMAQSMLAFNERLERVGEVAVVILVGGMLSTRYLPLDALWFVPVLFLVIRPLGVLIGLLGSQTTRIQRYLMSWFGIRGIGSIYYLMYAIEHGLSPAIAERLTAITLTTVAISVVIHGLSVTPLMNRYGRRVERRQRMVRESS